MEKDPEFNYQRGTELVARKMIPLIFFAIGYFLHEGQVEGVRFEGAGL